MNIELRPERLAALRLQYVKNVAKGAKTIDQEDAETIGILDKAQDMPLSQTYREVAQRISPEYNAMGVGLLGLAGNFILADSFNGLPIWVRAGAVGLGIVFTAWGSKRTQNGLIKQSFVEEANEIVLDSGNNPIEFI